MVKKIIPFLFLLTIIACSGPKIHIPAYYEHQYIYYGEENAKATVYSIKEAGKLSSQYPDEDILNDEIKITMRFEKNEDYDSTAFKKIAETAKKNKAKREKELANKQAELTRNLEKLLKGDYSNITQFAGNVEEELTENPIPDGEVFTSTKYEYEYTTLKDFVNEPFVVEYNSMTDAKNFTFKIDDKKTEIKKNKEKNDGGDYFKTDSRYLVYDLNLPIRGTRINARYFENCRDAKFNSLIYIPEEHLTKKKIIKISKPDWLEFDIIEKNFDGIDFKKEEVEEDDKSGDDIDDNGSNDKGKKGSKKSKYIVYTFKNLKPYQRFKGGRGPSYNIPMLYFHYKSVTTEKGKKNIFKSTDDMYKWYRLVSGTLQNDTSKFSAFTKNLVKNSKTDEEKLKTVFYWIQDNVRYIAFEDGIAGFQPDECNNVFSKKYGDCKGMANLCKNMLKVLGYDARLVWIGTRHLNFSYDIPGMPVDNHAICAVKLNKKFVFLDATETYCSLGDYANRIQGRKCIVEDGKGYLLETIPEFGPEHNEETTTETMDLNNSTLMVKGKKTFKGESKIDFLRDYNLMRSQKKNKALFDYLTGAQMSINARNIVSSDLTNRDIDVLLNYNLEVDNHAFASNGKKYVNLEWDRHFAGFNFDSIRNVDYDFRAKIDIRRNVVLNLKPGQKATNLPTPINIDNPYYNFILEIKQMGNTLVYKTVLITKQDYIPVSMFKTFNADSKKLSAFYNTYIELN